MRFRLHSSADFLVCICQLLRPLATHFFLTIHIFIRNLLVNALQPLRTQASPWVA
jgi:hypothetical protein